MSSKLGGDLYNLKFENKIVPLTMLIGIDVCHSGPQSIVGFCATINKEMSQYYSVPIAQARNQEIVGKELKEALKKAFESFSKHQGQLPNHLIIYRDGVGDGMRKDVVQKEISQFQKAIMEVYNKAKKQPYITVVIVNKRITQRFFIEDRDGNLANPPSGCLIDAEVVENEHEDEAGAFDFYLIPQQVTQGCALPTHFYVAFNDSPVPRDILENFTFHLCHYYFNWAGPIKVPAPCMYAHKVAELYTKVGGKVNTDKFELRLSESLHFL